MTFALDLTEEQAAIKHAVEEICAKYDDHYWLNVDNSGDFPDAFVNDIAEGGWLGVADMLARDVYATDALVPATPWLRPTNVAAQPPLLASLRCGMNASGQLPNTCHVDWGRAVKTDAFVTAIWAKYGTLWRFSVATNSSTFLPEQSGGHALREVVISRVDRYGVEGARSVLTRP